MIQLDNPIFDSDITQQYPCQNAGSINNNAVDANFACLDGKDFFNFTNLSNLYEPFLDMQVQENAQNLSVTGQETIESAPPKFIRVTTSWYVPPAPSSNRQPSSELGC